MKRFLSAALPSLVLLTASQLTAADWPRWRGADFDDVSKESGLLKQWPAEGPKKVWMSEKAGLGYSGYAIAAGTLYTLGLVEDTEMLLAFDAATGAPKWSTPIGPMLTNDWGNGPRSTPTVDGNRVYALSGQGHLHCINAADGKSLWNTTMKEFGGKTPGWGYTESVLVDGELVVCLPGGAQGTMLALNKMTGKKVWQSNEWTDDAQYGSIIPTVLNGARQYIALTTKNIGAINAKDGRKLWLSEFPGKTAVIPTPIVSGNDVYVSAGYGVGCKQVHIGAQNAATENWSNTNLINHHGGVVLHQGHLYGFSDKGGWTCQDWKTGEVKWADKSLGKGAIHCADGMLYLLEENSGTVALIEASPAGFKEHSRFKLDPQTTQRKPKGKIWTHPVVANGRLYLRDQELLFCFDISDPAAPKTATATAASGRIGASTPVQRSFTDPNQAQQAALKLFPALGVAGSPFNQAFLAKVQEARQSRPETLKDPNWPLKFAEEVAAALPR